MPESPPSSTPRPDLQPTHPSQQIQMGYDQVPDQHFGSDQTAHCESTTPLVDEANNDLHPTVEQWGPGTKDSDFRITLGGVSLGVVICAYLPLLGAGISSKISPEQDPNTLALGNLLTFMKYTLPMGFIGLLLSIIALVSGNGRIHGLITLLLVLLAPLILVLSMAFIF